MPLPPFFMVAFVAVCNFGSVQNRGALQSHRSPRFSNVLSNYCKVCIYSYLFTTNLQCTVCHVQRDIEYWRASCPLSTGCTARASVRRGRGICAGRDRATTGPGARSGWSRTRGSNHVDAGEVYSIRQLLWENDVLNWHEQLPEILWTNENCVMHDIPLELPQNKKIHEKTTDSQQDKPGLWNKVSENGFTRADFTSRQIYNACVLVHVTVSTYGKYCDLLKKMFENIISKEHIQKMGWHPLQIRVKNQGLNFRQTRQIPSLKNKYIEK